MSATRVRALLKRALAFAIMLDFVPLEWRIGKAQQLKEDQLEGVGPAMLVLATAERDDQELRLRLGGRRVLWCVRSKKDG
jgi:hypothetical protein